MEQDSETAVIFAPFWRQPGHVGNYRIDRFLRWLNEDGFQIVLVRAGSHTRRHDMPWGAEITVTDPLGLYREPTHSGDPIEPRKPNRLRRWLVTRVFNPDPGIVWAKAAARHRNVLEACAGASFVLSSSPPESAHVGAASLARVLDCPLIVDMRDGWLDDPLKPLLRDSRFRRWREGVTERSIVRQASKVFVTSSVWHEMLVSRFPTADVRTAVLTNGYPPDGAYSVQGKRSRKSGEPLRLIHAGRFTGSRLSQQVSRLLEPLSRGLVDRHIRGSILLLGNLEASDLQEVEYWQPIFRSKGWRIDVKKAVPRNEMMSLLGDADGYLLLSASAAALPSKLFEYLPFGLPILAATQESGALWQVGQSIEHVFLVDYRQPDTDMAKNYLSSCATISIRAKPPERFAESTLRRVFLREVRGVM